MRAFLRGFATGVEIDTTEADQQWAGFSASLGDAERRRIERGGYRAGEREARKFLRLYPEEQ